MPLLAIALLAAGTYAFRLAGPCWGTGCAGCPELLRHGRPVMTVRPRVRRGG
ncbi:hypothetical protein N5079_09320 [Planotetraspora sp. A-T 1434]|uniref:hypothetical protein n=1 Tax=Planotetraspora sp. A-T 1434 TaxID=2979219 RepID=UPI0021C01570|nr:hypothetical protein [Planotetraspora sp. A-T 1434]MCT9930420.1 hypothetical protein [Planotetraspora sp. A-T 1434]